MMSHLECTTGLMNSDSPILDLNCGADTERPMSDGENKSDNDDKLHIDVKDDEGVEGPSSSSTHHLGEHIMADGDVKEDSDEVGASSTSHMKEEEEEKKLDKRERRKAKSKYNNMENEDLEKMLKWKHGIGHLPGSNLKFRKSDTGTLEVITPISDEEDLMDGGRYSGSGLEKRGGGKRKRSFIKGGTKRINELSRSSSVDKSIPSPRSPKAAAGGGGGGSAAATTTNVKKEDGGSPDEKKKRTKDRKKLKFSDEDLLKCETCGCYGLISEFRSSGRFCSQQCVSAYAAKRRTEMIAEQLAVLAGERSAAAAHSAKNTKKSSKKSKKGGSDLSPFRTPSPSVDSTIDESKIFFADDAKLYYEAVGYEEEFDWDNYLKITGTRAAPLKSFIKEFAEQELFPRNGGQFRPKMKLECVDPRHQSCITVCTITEVSGARMRLHFDGWSESYDFWINTNSPFIFPCGWCEKNGQKLLPPRTIPPEEFHWSKYLHDTGCEAAPAYLFREVPKPIHKFTTKMKLEAVDRKNPDLVCVASVNNVIGEHFLIHFDEWDDQYDYWCREDSPFIHEVGWCSQNGFPLVPPTDEMVNNFSWEKYLRDTNCTPSPKTIFNPRPEPSFEVGMKLEIVDPRNSSLLRPASVCEVEQHQVKVHFDGWDSMLDYWFDSDSPDLHPVNWHKKTGHRLEEPPSGKETGERICSTVGCRGIGHIKGAKYTTHHTLFGCPYTPQNLNRSSIPVIDRLAPNAPAEDTSMLGRIHNLVNGNPVENTTGDNADNRKPKVKKRKYKRRDDVTTPTNSTTLTPAATVKNNFVNSAVKPIPSTHIAARDNNVVLPSGKAVPWTPEDVVSFLCDIGCGDFSTTFREHQIDGQALLLLSQVDLVRHLKLKLGPALKIYSEISKL